MLDSGRFQEFAMDRSLVDAALSITPDVPSARVKTLD
jgi:hypothetical protein